LSGPAIEFAKNVGSGPKVSVSFADRVQKMAKFTQLTFGSGGKEYSLFQPDVL
jgi:hypothetical protein